MRPALEEGLLQGRLECPNSKCGAQLGRYAWQGIKCSCGAWVCPAFSVLKSRIDEVVKRKENNNALGFGRPGSASEGGGIRLPPGMKGRENL
jgi:dual specificity phosphatase 12